MCCLGNTLALIFGGQSCFENEHRLVFTNLNGVRICRVDRELTFGFFHPLCVEDFVSPFVDDLYDRMLEIDVVFKMAGGFAAIVIVKIKSERPARKLAILIFGDVGKTLIAFKGDLTASFIKSGEAISVGTLLFVAAVDWVRVS